MTMNTDEEEKLLHHEIIYRRQIIEEVKKEKRRVEEKLRAEESNLEALEEAALQYMVGNGLKQSEYFTLSSRESVDVPDIDALPPEYVRVKREADKSRIAKERPESNWYTIKKTNHLLLRGLK